MGFSSSFSIMNVTMMKNSSLSYLYCLMIICTVSSSTEMGYPHFTRNRQQETFCDKRKKQTFCDEWKLLVENLLTCFSLKSKFGWFFRYKCSAARCSSWTLSCIAPRHPQVVLVSTMEFQTSSWLRRDCLTLSLMCQPWSKKLNLGGIALAKPALVPFSLLHTAISCCFHSIPFYRVAKGPQGSRGTPGLLEMS